MWCTEDGSLVYPLQTDATGTFTMKLRRGSRGRVLAQKLGFGAGRRTAGPVESGLDPVEVGLRAEGHVEVTFRGTVEALRSIDTVGVTADGDDAMTWYPDRREIRTRRADERRYVLDGLPPGRLRVFGRSSVHRFEGAAEVVGGETVTLTIE
jgi:hypothetical protein